MELPEPNHAGWCPYQRRDGSPCECGELERELAAQEATYWNGERCQARRVRMIVGEPPLPSWWCAGLAGDDRAAVEVVYRGQVFYLDDEDGSGWRKVTEGRGSPSWPHRSLPDGSQPVS